MLSLLSWKSDCSPLIFDGKRSRNFLKSARGGKESMSRKPEEKLKEENAKDHKYLVPVSDENLSSAERVSSERVTDAPDNATLISPANSKYTVCRSGEMSELKIKKKVTTNQMMFHVQPTGRCRCPQTLSRRCSLHQKQE